MLTPLVQVGIQRVPVEHERALVRVGPHADPEVPYMLHCHLLRHEDEGMMSQFVVVRPGEPPGTPPAVPDEDHHG